MDQIILALLLLKNRTIYELREKVESRLSLMYSSSTGSIQSALKKLLSEEMIVFSEQVENGRRKKLYIITERGRQKFNEWVNTPFRAAQNKNPELAKLYFMGLSDSQSRPKRIKAHINCLEAYHRALSDVYREGLTLTPPDEYAEVYRFQLITVKYGVDSTGFEIRWMKKLLKELEENP